MADKAKKLYVTQWLKFDPMELCAATLVFEGTKEEVAFQEHNVYTLAKKFGGIKADEENGRRGYYLTFMIAYLRDFAFEMSYFGESFETAVPWSKCLTLCKKVKERIVDEAKKSGVAGNIFVTCRVTQVYDVGACVYFYFGFGFKGLPNAIDKFNHVEHSARDEIMKHGGSISHHHGIGKHRKDFMERQITPLGVSTLRGIKNLMDPKNIFANGNLIDLEPTTTKGH
jgi:alkyldihydroxyacetonephosphate synthase